jgi:hypothetical protein
MVLRGVMQKLPRSVGPFFVSEGLRRLLVCIRLQRGITAAPDVRLSELREAERELGGRIPNELLGLWLGLGRSVGELVQLTQTVGTFYERAGKATWRQDFNFDLLAFDLDFDDGSGRGVLCSSRDEPARLSLWNLEKAEATEPDFVTDSEPPLITYVRAKFSAEGKTPVNFDKALPAGALTKFHPSIVGAPAPAQRQVRHGSFGIGLVLRNIEPDKLEVDFGPHGVRKLMARVVQNVV